MGHIKVFMFAGHDTTSSTICFAAYELAEHPEAMQKVRHEYDEVFGTDVSETAQKIKDDPYIINRLPYTAAVIKEVLRLWPPASSVRMGEPGFFLNYEGKKYPTKGLMTWPIIYAVQRSPKLWPEPHAFIPERWLAKEGDPLFPIRGARRPFEFGPRNCIGQELAMIETKVIMVLMLRQFDTIMAHDEFDRSTENTGVKTTPEAGRAYQVRTATAKPANGMPSRVKRI